MARYRPWPGRPRTNPHTFRYEIPEEHLAAYRAASDEWADANPQRHQPHEVCDCKGMPKLFAASTSNGHCAVRHESAAQRPAP